MNPNKPMNALELLKNDHQRVYDLFEQLQQATNIEEKRDIFDAVRDELTMHADLEETEFYPLFNSKEGFEDLIDESIDDHSEMRDLIEEIDSIDDETEMEDRLDELQEIVDGHVTEEESQLFPRIQKVMGEEELVELGQRMIAFKMRQKPASKAA